MTYDNRALIAFQSLSLGLRDDSEESYWYIQKPPKGVFQRLKQSALSLLFSSIHTISHNEEILENGKSVRKARHVRKLQNYKQKNKCLKIRNCYEEIKVERLIINSTAPEKERIPKSHYFALEDVGGHKENKECLLCELSAGGKKWRVFPLYRKLHGREKM